jgi:hypothetical protein
VSRRDRITKELLAEPGTDANIAGRDPAWTGGPEFDELSSKQLSRTAKELLARGVKELSKAQELLWASDTYALLVVFQALDAAGMDSTIGGGRGAGWRWRPHPWAPGCWSVSHWAPGWAGG